MAELWKLPLEIALAIEYHHHPNKLASKNETAVLVYVVDQICQRFGLGYGYELTEAATGSLEQVWSTLSQSIRCAADYSAEQYMTLIEQQVATAQTLVDEVFSPAPAPAG